MSNELKHLLSEEEAEQVTGGAVTLVCPLCGTEHACNGQVFGGVQKYFCRNKNMYFALSEEE